MFVVSKVEVGRFGCLGHRRGIERGVLKSQMRKENFGVERQDLLRLLG